MSFRIRQGILPIAAVVLFSTCGTLQKTTKRKSGGAQTTPVVAQAADTSKKQLSKLKPYKEVITAKAVTDSGLFIVHKVEDKNYFEIPNSLLDRDILVVTRISKAAAEVRPSRGFLGYKGDEIGETVIQFSQGPNNRVFIKRMSYFERSVDSSENGMYRSVVNSNVQPIIESFDIKAIAPDSSGVVIDLTDYINGDNELLGFNGDGKKIYTLGALQANKSYIEGVHSYPMNVEIKTVKTYGIGENAHTYGLNSSIILLPAEPMQGRYWDDRVGYFGIGYVDFDKNPQGVESNGMITRWRLEPKEEDIEKYKAGQLVEPKKPIVFYIDPATPKRWVPYLIAGVNDWQQAFEKAGFKNAIYALEAPKDDSTWSLEDMRHNAIIYKPSYVPNAYGPHVNDPRTGEILESKIGWFHNVMELLHDWYMIQAGPNDPKARKIEFDDSLMGQLIRFVSSHEVGHTLGLAHNFGASSTIPVDSLRSKRYVEANGFCPSIMDYARFNYVAQPEDHISEKGIFPRIGVYDEWAIEWGYRWLPELKTEKEDRAYMNKWINERVGKDKRLWYGSQSKMYDPRCQSEDLGDDPGKAGTYGIKNLQRVMNNLVNWTWTTESGETNDVLTRIHKGVIAQYKRYITHAAFYMGQAVYYNSRRGGDKGSIFDFPSREKQRAAFRFLEEQLFKTPNWLGNGQVFSLTGSGAADLQILQGDVIKFLLSNTNLGMMSTFAEKYSSQQSYRVSDLLNDFKASFWGGLGNHKPIDATTRTLQRLHISQLISVLQEPGGTLNPFNQVYYRLNSETDIHTLVRVQLNNLLHEIDHALPRYKDTITRIHLQEMRRLINETLNPEGSSKEGGHDHSGHSHLDTIENLLDLLPLYKEQEGMRGCWEEE